MSATYDLYQPGDSWLHRRDPRVKLVAVVCACALLLLFRNLWIMMAALLVTHVILWSATIARERLLWVWKLALPTMVMILLLWVLFYPRDGQELLRFWFVHVTVQNLAEGAAMALRLAALAFVVFGWLFTTPQSTIVRSLVSLGMPYEWGLVLGMALRYLPTMAATFRMISDAQQARALDLQRKGLLKRARAYLPISVAALIITLRTAESLARALESRALGAPRQRSCLHALHFSPLDLVLLFSIIVISGLLLWARFALAFGIDPVALPGLTNVSLSSILWRVRWG